MMQYLPIIGLILSTGGTLLLLADRLGQAAFRWPKRVAWLGRLCEWINSRNGDLYGLMLLLFGFFLQLIGVVNLGVAYAVRIDWQAIAAIGTWAVVLVTAFAVGIALLPILDERRHRKAEARFLRVQLCTALSAFRPTLDYVVKPLSDVGVLSLNGFLKELDSIRYIIREAIVLECDEQEHLAIVFANLRQAEVPLYVSCDLDVRVAEDILASIDRAIRVMEKYPVLSDDVHKPWKQQDDNQ